MKLKQLLHRDCNGALVVATDDSNNLYIACTKCFTYWDLTGKDSNVKASEDFITGDLANLTDMKKTKEVRFLN